MTTDIEEYKEAMRDARRALGEARDAIKADVTQYKQKMSKKRNP